MAKSEVAKLNGRIASWVKRGTKWAEDGLELMGECIAVALDNGNIDPMKRVVSSLTGSDLKDALTIFTTFFPLVVKDGELSVAKGWSKRVPDLPDFGATVERLGVKTFRKLAEALRPDATEEDKPAFDLAAYLKGIEKLNKRAKDGDVPADLIKRMDDLVSMLKAHMEPGADAHADAPQPALVA